MGEGERGRWNGGLGVGRRGVVGAGAGEDVKGSRFITNIGDEVFVARRELDLVHRSDYEPRTSRDTPTWKYWSFFSAPPRYACVTPTKVFI